MHSVFRPRYLQDLTASKQDIEDILSIIPIVRTMRWKMNSKAVT